jgi:hypothetical protein
MYLQLDTRFNPFTYDEMVKPLLYYKQAYDEAEAAYSALSSDTDAWKNRVDKNNSPLAYEQFQRYSGDLSRTVDDFSRGMNAKNRRALLGLKRRYASEIKPIEDAYNRRTVLAEEQRKANLANPTMLWQRKASDMSLDDFIKNPDADYGRSTSGTALTAQVAAGAGALAKEFRDNPEKMRKLVGGDYYEYVKQRGFSSEAVLAAIMNNPNASPILNQLVEGAIDSAGLKEWADASTLSQAYNYARQGLWNAVGQEEAQLVQNWRAQENLSHSHAMARQASAQAFQAAEAEKNRQFQREQSSPRAIIGNDGKPTGEYYDPKLGVVVDNKGNIIGTPKSKNTQGPDGNKRDPNDPRPKELMQPLYFDAFYNDTSSGLTYKAKWDGNIDEAGRQLIYSKGKHVSGSGVPNKLSTKALADIRAKLPKGMSLSDVDVYVDHDSWSDSHYIVVDSRGDILGREKVATSTPTSGSKGSQSAGL